MGSDTRLASFACIACLAVTLPACAATERRFPLRAPIWRDGDLGSFVVACHAAPDKKDPRHISCAPRVDEATLIWDGVDNMVFRPMSEGLGLVTSGEAVDVNSLDEVPDSAWFTNRIGMHPYGLDQLELGACTPAQLLDGTTAADGTWVVDHGKMNGSTDGFRVTIPGKGKFLFKADDADTPEHASAAQTIGAKALYAAGYYTSCEQVVVFRPSVLKLTPGLHWKHNFGEEEPFDQKALNGVLGHTAKQGPFVRMAASLWLPGSNIGAFRFEGTRDDDPGDVVPHQDRRELRGLRLLDAWLERHDERAGNTVDMWHADNQAVPDSSPGHVIHNQLDTSEILGSTWDWDPISVRLGYSYVLDWGDLSGDFVTLGARRRPWDTWQHKPGDSFFALYDVEHFDPEAWKNEYPVSAFSRMTERDGAWMARILARFTPEMVGALARSGRLTDPGKTAYLEQVLQGRLDKVLERYLTRLSPVTDVHVEGTSVCGVDLVEWRGMRDAGAFRYTARVLGAGWLSVERRPGGGVCVPVPHVAADGGAADDAAERYVRVRLEDGVDAGPLIVHLYDLGPARGFALAGLERMDP
jgi:hypothetical protein